MLIPSAEVNILNTFRVMIILKLLSLLTNLHLKLLSTRGTGADKLLSTQRVKEVKVKDAKYLGVTVSDDLEWTKHINAITTKANSKLSFLRRN